MIKRCRAKFKELSEEELYELKDNHKDKIGYSNNYLTIIDIIGIDKNNCVYTISKCSCGSFVEVSYNNIKSGAVKSCGCLQKKIAHETKSRDLTGMIFGKLTALYEVDKAVRSDRSNMWYCSCSCGGFDVVSSGNLLSGAVKSCGCAHAGRLIKDITGYRSGYLVALKQVGISDDRHSVWECLCEGCGRTCLIKSNTITSQKQLSCGCIKSSSEEIIANFLRSNGISFERQKTFSDCVDKRPLIFDFYISSRRCAIEFDGEFHYMETSLGNDLEGQQRRDAIKTKYCEENDIILLRIPYWEKNNIESILSDWLFLNTGE